MREERFGSIRVIRIQAVRGRWREETCSHFTAKKSARGSTLEHFDPFDPLEPLRAAESPTARCAFGPESLDRRFRVWSLCGSGARVPAP